MKDLTAITDKWERLKSHIEDRQKTAVPYFSCGELLDLMKIIEKRTKWRKY